MTDSRTWRRLGYAAALSGAVHAGVILFGRLELPHEPADLPPLAVRLEPVRGPALAPVVPRRAERPVPRGIPVRQTTQPLAAPGPQGANAESVSAASEDPQPVEVAETPPPVEPVVVATAPPSTYAPPDVVALPSFPRRGRISFNVVYGRDGFPVGRTEQSWQIDGTRYQLASRSETTGVVDLFRSQHRTYLSRGELTPKGFRPESFLMSRNRGRGPEEARAQFDWSGGTIQLGAVSSQRSQPLPAGSQDIVSFMYQLALDPPAPGRRAVAVTNGSKLEIYELDVRAEEKIETPIGVMRALPIRQVRSSGQESVEVWLATEYRHLPVRIRFYGRDGEPSGEQVVTQIRLSDE